jgi:tetratricopeptide (TPR) repeat protein
MIILRLAVLAAALAAGPRDPQIRWCPDYDQAFVEARDRNVPVLVAFIQDGEAQNEQMVTECYSDRPFIRQTKLTVNLIASQGTSDRHGVAEAKGPDGTVRKVCKKFGSVTCIEHQQIERRAFLDFSTDGTIHTPHHVLVTPDGEVITRADDYIECSQLMSMIQMARARVGPGLDQDTYETVQENLEKGEAALASKEYGTALECFTRAADVKALAPILERVREKRDALVAKGWELLEESKRLAKEKQYVEALSILEDIQGEFRRVRDLAREVKTQKDLLHANPEAQEARRILELEPRAKKLLARAMEAFREENYAGSAALLASVLEKFEGTPSAKIARARLEELKSDPEMRRRIEEAQMKKDCSQWLNLARNYLRSGLRDKAREYCEKILEGYPDSEFAAEARALLEELDEEFRFGAR